MFGSGSVVTACHDSLWFRFLATVAEFYAFTKRRNRAFRELLGPGRRSQPGGAQAI
jgi:hypothetical protein